MGLWAYLGLGHKTLIERVSMPYIISAMKALTILFLLAACLPDLRAQEAGLLGMQQAQYKAMDLLRTGARERGGFGAMAPADAPAQRERAKLRYSPACIMAGVARMMHITLRQDAAMPSLFIESDIPFSFYQDAVEPQWGFRPEQFVSVYVTGMNAIFLSDEAEWRRRMGRFIDDSLAHEFVHYFQTKYLHIGDFNDFMEMEAILIQTQFREKFLSPGPEAPSPCKE